MNQNITGVVIAGGKSSRMGEPKSFVPYKGIHLIDYSINALLSVTNSIVISISQNDTSKYPFITIKDECIDIGPIGGIYSVLKSVQTSVVLCLSCDVPLVTSSVLNSIIFNALCYDVVVAKHSNDKIEPLVACYNKSILPKMEEAILQNRYSLYSLIKSSNYNEVYFNDASVFKNVNTKNDLV